MLWHRTPEFRGTEDGAGVGIDVGAGDGVGVGADDGVGVGAEVGCGVGVGAGVGAAGWTTALISLTAAPATTAAAPTLFPTCVLIEAVIDESCAALSFVA